MTRNSPPARCPAALACQAIYHTLNKCSVDVTRKVLVAEAWVPASARPRVQEALRAVAESTSQVRRRRGPPALICLPAWWGLGGGTGVGWLQVWMHEAGVASREGARSARIAAPSLRRQSCVCC